MKEDYYQDKNVGENVGEKLNKTQRKIVAEIKGNPNITIEMLYKKLNLTQRTIERNLKFLRENGIITRDGNDRNGKWIIR